MSPVKFAEGEDRSTFANRGITDWQVTRSSDGASLACNFRASGGSDAHYGGLSMRIPGRAAFRLTVTFAKGAEAVRSVFVTAISPKGTEAGRWGYGVRDAGSRLYKSHAYDWEFVPGEAGEQGFWVIPGKTNERDRTHLFVDVDPGAEVKFTVAHVERQP